RPHPDVVGGRAAGREGAGLVVAGLVRTAVVAAGGRCAARAHVQVGVAGAAGDRDRGGVAGGDRHGVGRGPVAGGHGGQADAVAFVAAVIATATAAGGVVADQADPGEGRIGLEADVVGTGRRRRVAAALRVARLVRTAVVGRVGRRAAVLHVHVGVAGAPGHGEAQVGRARGHGHRVVHRAAAGRADAGDRDALGQGAAGAAATTATAAGRAAHADRGERRGDVGLGVAQVGRRALHAAGALVEAAAGRPVVAVGHGEHLEGLHRVPAALLGPGAERLVVHARAVVHVDAAVVVVGVVDRAAVLGRVAHVAQRAAALEDLGADQPVVVAVAVEVLGGLAGHVGERLVHAAGLARVGQVGVLLGE